MIATVFEIHCVLQYCVLFLQLCAGWGRFANWPHFKTPWAQRDMG